MNKELYRVYKIGKEVVRICKQTSHHPMTYDVKYDKHPMITLKMWHEIDIKYKPKLNGEEMKLLLIQDL